MQNFFDLSLEQQAKLAIDNGDVKLLQLVLGMENLQVTDYLLARANMTYNLVTASYNAKYTVLLEIIKEKSGLLEELRERGILNIISQGMQNAYTPGFFFNNLFNSNEELYDSASRIASERNEGLKEQDEKILKRSKEKIEGHEKSSIKPTTLEDWTREIALKDGTKAGIPYTLTLDSDEHDQIAEVREATVIQFAEHPILQFAKDLDFKKQEKKILAKTKEEIKNSFKDLELSGHYADRLAEQLKQLQDDEEQITNLIFSSHHVISKLQDSNEIQKNLFDSLLDHYISHALHDKTHLLHNDIKRFAKREIREKFLNIKKPENLSEELNSLLAHSMHDESNISEGIIQLLICNKASLQKVIETERDNIESLKKHNERASESKRLNNIKLRGIQTKEEILNLLNNIGNKSPITPIKESLELLFNFPIRYDNGNCRLIEVTKVLFALPSSNLDLKTINHRLTRQSIILPSKDNLPEFARENKNSRAVKIPDHERKLVFTKSAESKEVWTELGGKEEQNVSAKLDKFHKSIKGTKEKNESFVEYNGWYNWYYNIFDKNDSDAHYRLIDRETYNAMEIVFIAIATADDRILIDHANKLSDKYDNKNKFLSELRNLFTNVKKNFEDYYARSHKDYSVSYKTFSGLWPKINDEKFKERFRRERDAYVNVFARSNELNKDLKSEEDEKKAQNKTMETKEKEGKGDQTASANQQSAVLQEQLDQADQRADEANQRADQTAQQLDQVQNALINKWKKSIEKEIKRGTPYSEIEEEISEDQDLTNDMCQILYVYLAEFRGRGGDGLDNTAASASASNNSAGLPSNNLDSHSQQAVASNDLSNTANANSVSSNILTHNQTESISQNLDNPKLDEVVVTPKSAAQERNNAGN